MSYSRLRELLANPVAVLILLPVLPLVVLLALLEPAPQQTSNIETWTITEDPETGAIRVEVRRDVKRRY